MERTIPRNLRLIGVTLILLCLLTAAWWMTRGTKTDRVPSANPGSGERGTDPEKISRKQVKLAIQPSFSRMGWEHDKVPTLEVEALLVHGEKAVGDWTFEVNGKKRFFSREEIQKELIREFFSYGNSVAYAHSLSKSSFKPGETLDIRVRFRGEVDGKPVVLTAKDRITFPGMKLQMTCKDGEGVLTAELTHAQAAQGDWSLTTGPRVPAPGDEGESMSTLDSSLSTGLRHTMNVSPHSFVTVKMRGKIDGIPWEVRASTTYDKHCRPLSPVRVVQGAPPDEDRLRRYTLSLIRYRQTLLTDPEWKTGPGIRVTAWLKTDQPAEGRWIFFLQGKEEVKVVRDTFSNQKITVDLPVKKPGHNKLNVAFEGTINGRIFKDEAVSDVIIPNDK